MTIAVDSRSLVRFAAAVVATALLLVAAGCSLSRPAPVKHTFLIDPPLPAGMSRAHPGTLRVGAINVAAPFRARAFVYRTSPLGFEADFYSEFLVAPAAMISEATARALDRAGVYAKVIPPGFFLRRRLSATSPASCRSCSFCRRARAAMRSKSRLRRSTNSRLPILRVCTVMWHLIPRE
jgi:hypothetical protein